MHPRSHDGKQVGKAEVADRCCVVGDHSLKGAMSDLRRDHDGKQKHEPVGSMKGVMRNG